MDKSNENWLISLKEIIHLELGPNEDSFANKYKIRQILNSVAGQAKLSLSNEDLYLKLVWGFCYAKLANNYIETDEPVTEAKVCLLEVIKDLEPSQNKLYFAGVLQYAYNSLAAIADVDDADTVQPTIDLLIKSKNVFEEFRKTVNDTDGPDCWELICNSSSSSKLDTTIRFLVFESGYFTTLFLLAQIFSKLKDKQNAAKFCQETLLRQLILVPTAKRLRESPEFQEFESTYSHWILRKLPVLDLLEWSTNASTLSVYYSEIGDNVSALECLLTAKSVLELPSVKPLEKKNSEKKEKIAADVARLTAQYSLELLKQGSENVIDAERNLNTGVISSSKGYGNLFSQDTGKALEEAFGEPLSGVDTTTAISILTSPPKVYNEAVKLFRWTCKCLSESLSYYKLNEHCPDAIELIRDHASAFNYLADFEADLSRKCCMQKRRVDLLENLLKELNPQFYMTSCRILMSECADALTTLRDLNEQKLERAAQSSELGSYSELLKQTKKVNNLSQRAIEMYARLIDSFRVPATQQQSEFYEETWLRSILMAYFYSARLHSKIIVPGPPKAGIKNLLTARENYAKMVEIAEKHVKNGCEIDIPEVEIAKEMTILLAAKIAAIPQND